MKITKSYTVGACSGDVTAGNQLLLRVFCFGLAISRGDERGRKRAPPGRFPHRRVHG